MKRKYVWIVFIISILALVPFRIYQRTSLDESLNRVFGVSKSDIGILILFLLFVLIINVMTNLLKDASRELKISKNILASILACLTGIIILVGSIVQLVPTFNSLIENQNTKSGLLKVNSDRVKESIELVNAQITIERITIVKCCLGVVAFLGFIVIAFILFNGKETFPKISLASVLPALWAILNVVELFMSRITLVSEKNDVFNIFEVIFVLLFLFMQAKFFAGIDVEHKKILSYGIFTALSICLHNIPCLAADISSIEQLEFQNVLPYISSLTLGCYILLFLVYLKVKDESESYINDDDQHINLNSYEDTFSHSSEDTSSDEVFSVKNEVQGGTSVNTSIMSNDNVKLDVEMLQVNELIDKLKLS